MLEANLQALRMLAPGLKFTVLSGDPAWTSRRYGVESLQGPRIPEGHTAGSWTRRLVEAGDPAAWSGWLGEEICAALRNCAGLVISGGGNISASWPEHVLERVALIELAHTAGIPSVMTGQTLGPAVTPDQRQLLEGTLPKLKWIGVRDEGSAALARDLGVPPEAIHQQLDDAFLLEPVAPAGESMARFRGGQERWIAVTLDASFAAAGRARALEVLASQLDSLARHLAASIVFVPHVSGEASGDAAAGRALAAHLRSPLLQLDLLDPSEVRWLMGQAGLVISTRYHPLVFAASAGTPALGIWTDAYTRVKLRGALAPAGLEGYAIPLQEAERGSFLPLALELWHWRDAVRKQLARLHREAQAWEAERWRGVCRCLNLGANAEPSPAPPHPVSIGPLGPFVSSPATIAEEQWHQYDRDGYLRLGRLLDEQELTILQERIDAIMLGRIRYPTLQMQLDTGGRYEELPDPVETFLGETLQYRKIQGLEADPLVLEFIRRDLFREICARHYGAHAAVSLFRVMMMNKPAGQGTYLPWHQDAGDVWKLDRDPLVTLWIALDPSTRANGCVQVIPGTHRLGLLSRNGSNIGAADTERYCREDMIEYLELEAGEGLLLHNWLLHRSDVNRTGTPRRALSACYMDGRTVNTLSGKRYPIVFGDYPDIEAAMPFLQAIQEENRHLREAAEEAARYAKSLAEDNQRREQMRCEAEKYAKSLEEELARLRSSATPAGLP
jgi:polysaccharide pyruvyl transferase WcaK-like protein